jgi:hypothetical protein
MSHNPHAAEHGVGHETRDVSMPPIVLTSFILLAVVLLSFVTMWWLLTFLTTQEIEKQGPISKIQIESRREEPPQPHLQTHPLRDMQDLRAAENEILENYGWIDKGAGVVRLPIQRALELTAERGLPAK